MCSNGHLAFGALALLCICFTVWLWTSKSWRERQHLELTSTCPPERRIALFDRWMLLVLTAAAVFVVLHTGWHCWPW
jgi:hypothetical protein